MRRLLPLCLILVGCSAAPSVHPVAAPSQVLQTDSLTVAGTGAVVLKADPCESRSRMPTYRPQMVPNMPSYKPERSESGVPACASESAKAGAGEAGKIKDIVVILDGEVLGSTGEAYEQIPAREQIESITIRSGAAAEGEYKLQRGQSALIVSTRVPQRAP